ncbi:YggS family pyridoxal phosphate-dependent enzyme [Geofilum sp. OHC36d9]|uniref:YggS family pyridoxal phosphate-dependent enzyme n=1 Tax=Geofilum sp. OHC36d9 TaxID=3458413 RepID=UPI0040348E06
MSVAEKLEEIRKSIPDHVELVAVSKTHPTGLVREAYEVGQRVFGENKVQELVAKAEALPKDIKWHMIGHMQSNKVKYIAPFVSLIHGVDSLKLLKVINNEGARNKRIISCLLQVHIATESTKFGFSPEELLHLFESFNVRSLENVQVCGLMGMATFTDNQTQIKNEFHSLRVLFDRIKNQWMSDVDYFREISMGMSNDYLLAIEEGCTMVRVGSAIFGAR